MPDILNYQILKSKIFSLTHDDDFNETALEVFYYQFEKNKLYGEFCSHLHRNPGNVNKINDIPFLPISFFKNHKLLSSENPPEIIFKSSGTTGLNRSSHYITDIELYKTSFRSAFKKFYGEPSEYTIFALLPSYLQQGASSLVYMAHQLIKDSCNPMSGFYLDNLEDLYNKLLLLAAQNKKVLLLGVTYALLDLMEKYPFTESKNIIIMETGGMKGRRKEMVREELHQQLKDGFGVESIHSEYGMTELLSQAYSNGNGIFYPSTTMRVYIRDTNDPLSLEVNGKSGGINIVDLANLNSCAFIATQDLGKKFSNGSFKVLGRFDNSDIRGCNLLIQ